MNNIYQVKTFTDASTIIQESGFDSNLVGSMSKQIIDLQEQGVRNALISLGWTPPNGDKSESNRY